MQGDEVTLYTGGADKPLDHNVADASLTLQSDTKKKFGASDH